MPVICILVRLLFYEHLSKQARDFSVFSCFSCIFARVREPSASSRGCRHTPAHAVCRTLTNVAPVFSVASGIFAIFPDNGHGMDKAEIVILIFSRTNDARFFSLFSPAFHKPACPQGLPDKTQKPMFRRTWAFVGAMEGTRTPGLLIRSQSLYPAELPTHEQVL